MKGVVFQMSTAMTAASAVPGLAVQATGLSMRPTVMKSALMTPKTSLNIQLHICAETTVGIAQGIRTAVRSRPRPGKWALSESAMASPRMVSMVTERGRRLSVFQTACHQPGRAADSRS